MRPSPGSPPPLEVEPLAPGWWVSRQSYQGPYFWRYWLVIQLAGRQAPYTVRVLAVSPQAARRYIARAELGEALDKRLSLAQAGACAVLWVNQGALRDALVMEARRTASLVPDAFAWWMDRPRDGLTGWEAITGRHLTL